MAANEQDAFSGVGEAPPALRLDAAALEAYLTARIDGFKGPIDVKKFKGGQSNPTYLLTTPSGRYVLRRKPPGDLLPSAHAVDREHRVMTALGAQGFPVPKTFLLCEDEAVIGSVFFIMDFVEGRIFWDASLEAEPKEARAPLHLALVDTIADLHMIDPDTAGLSDFGRRDGYFARQIARWSKQYKAAETEANADMDRLIEWLPENIPADDATSVVHGDFRLDNVIFANDGPRALAVIDWELSTLGHPLADFTYFLLAWKFPASVRGGLLGRDLEALGLPTMETAIARYCERTGRESVPDLDFCFAYNMFRIAAILQGVYARALQGNASSAEAAKTGASVAPLAAAAWGHARAAGASDEPTG
ncbi:MAG: phosphotransferase family protein [Parvularculaceae bacterium]